jgi:hypothetical protein
MEKDTNEYETPKIEDRGDLVELTAGVAGPKVGAVLPALTVLSTPH